MARRVDFVPFLMLTCAVLTLSGVTLAAPPAPPPPIMEEQNKPAAQSYDDGDGDELLEHWGDPKYSREEQVQMAGALGGFVLLGGLAWRKRSRRHSPVALTLMDVSEQRKAA